APAACRSGRSSLRPEVKFSAETLRRRREPSFIGSALQVLAARPVHRTRSDSGHPRSEAMAATAEKHPANRHLRVLQQKPKHSGVWVSDLLNCRDDAMFKLSQLISARSLAAETEIF